MCSWGERNEDTYAFEVDFYLYIILMIYATAMRKGGTLDPKSIPYFRCFFLEGEDILDKSYYKSSDILNHVLIGKNALSLAMDQNCSDEALKGVTFKFEQKSLLDPGVDKRKISNVSWFNKRRTQRDSNNSPKGNSLKRITLSIKCYKLGR